MPMFVLLQLGHAFADSLLILFIVGTSTHTEKSASAGSALRPACYNMVGPKIRLRHKQCAAGEQFAIFELGEQYLDFHKLGGGNAIQVRSAGPSGLATRECGIGEISKYKGSNP
jgi:hypothetical protein